MAAFHLILRAPRPRGTIWRSLDDTRVRMRGASVFAAGAGHDPMLSTRARHVVTRGLAGVVRCVVVRLPCCPDRAFGLPVAARLDLDRRASTR